MVPHSLVFVFFYLAYMGDALQQRRQWVQEMRRFTTACGVVRANDNAGRAKVQGMAEALLASDALLGEDFWPAARLVSFFNSCCRSRPPARNTLRVCTIEGSE